jgi:thiol-disulfide isomerase/thioredoxin
MLTKRERYGEERVAALDDEFQRLAQTRLAALDDAYAVLFDPERRHAYDVHVGLARPHRENSTVGRSRLTRREVISAISAALAGLFVIAVVWALASRSAEPALPPVAELHRLAPNFVLPGLDGTTVRLSDYRGKVVLVNFWATWCEPCKEETPALAAVYRKLRDQGLVIVGVDLRNQERAGADSDADVRAFVERYGVTYPVAGETARAFQIYPIPTSYFIDPRGDDSLRACWRIDSTRGRSAFYPVAARCIHKS